MDIFPAHLDVVSDNDADIFDFLKQHFVTVEKKSKEGVEVEQLE